MRSQKVFQKILLILLVLMHMTTMVFANPGDFIIYENKSYNIAFQYPSDWKFVEGFMETVVAFLSPPENANDTFSENVNLIIDELAQAPGVTLDEYFEVSRAQLATSITDYSLVSTGDSTISGMPAKTLVFTGSQDGFTLKWYQVYIIANNKAYVVTFTAENVKYQQYEPLGKTIIHSLVIK